MREPLFAARKWKISMLSNMGVPLAENRRWQVRAEKGNDGIAEWRAWPKL